MSKRYSGKSFKDRSIKKKLKISKRLKKLLKQKNLNSNLT